MTVTLRLEATEFRAKRIGELSDDEIAGWQSIVAENPRYRSPFFAPGYAMLVGRCIENVMVGLILNNGRIAGVFPYELVGDSRSGPVGSIFCDYQAVVAREDLAWTADALLDGLGLISWRFDHILTSQHQWSRYHRVQDVSWVIDLSGGFDAYANAMRRAGRGQLAEVRRKRRMIEREVGPLSFTPHEIDHTLLDHMLTLKSAQWARGGWAGRFTAEWELRLMHGLLETDRPDFAGMFSVLRAGGHPVAMHIGMRSAHTWHYWTTAYDPEFKRYSPGLIMLIEMLQHAPAMGLVEVDLGKEDFEYKRRLYTHAIPLAEGTASITESVQ